MMMPECGCEACDVCRGLGGWFEDHYHGGEFFRECARCKGTGHVHPQECPVLNPMTQEEMANA